MNCPVCNDVRMREVEKEGVLIDVCPSCKGVWLDRGELEKLMTEVKQERQMYNEWYNERNTDSNYNQQPMSSQPNRPQANYHQPNYQQANYQHYDSYNKSPYYKHKKKKTLFDRLEDLFD